jgi:hypothetical protein
MTNPVQIAVNTLPVQSRIIIPFDLRYDGENCLVEVIPRGNEIRAYGYRQNDSNVPELDGAQATDRDTPLLKASETRGGSRYIIQGLSISVDGEPYDIPANDGNHGLRHYLWPASSELPCNQGSGPLTMSVEDKRSLQSSLVQAFCQTYKLSIDIDGDTRVLQMGIPIFYPGQGGVKDTLATSNGDTFCANFMPIPETIAWNPGGTVDSNLVVMFRSRYSIWMPTWTTPAGTANGLPYAAETNPKIADAVETAWGRKWLQAFVVNFHGRQEQPVSNVS